MMTEPNLPFVVIPASGDDACIVQGVHVGGSVEVTLSWAIRQPHRFRSDEYAPTRLLAVQRFHRSDIAGYTTFAGHLEDSARIAVRGELGYSVHTGVQDGELSVSLVARLLEPDGRIHTEISHDNRFAEADSELALVQANEKATELRALAEELTDRWTSEWDAQVSELRAGYEKIDAQDRAAAQLQRIVDSEGA